MFRSIPSRFASAPRSLLVISTINRSLRLNFQHLSFRMLTQPGPVHPYRYSTLVPKSLFPAITQPRFTSEAEKKVKLEDERQSALKRKLEVGPVGVDRRDSVVHISNARSRSSDGPDMLRGLKSDLRTVKETFELKGVPKEVLYIGMGGLIPYLGTSLSALYLAWDINYSAYYGTGFLVSSDTAGHLLHILEPLQIGLGATILSFLGAVHWGLEMAEYGGKHPYKRYSLSILAPMLAWPTLMLPIDYALIAQFVGFSGMYFADSTATTNGWTPRWYMTYRFLLTFVVGASIVMTLIARGRIGDRVSGVKSPASYLQDLHDSQRGNLQKEEEEERKKPARKEETRAKKVEKVEKVEKEDATTAVNENDGGGYGDDDKDKGNDTKGKGEGRQDGGKNYKTAADLEKGAEAGKQGSGDSNPTGPTIEKQVMENPNPEAKENNAS